MNETLDLILAYARMVWRFRWVALATALLICILGWAVVQLIPNVYQVEAKVFLDTRSSLRPLLKGIAVDSSTREDTANMIQRTLLTRPNLEAVARKTDMDLKAKTPRDMEILLQNLAQKVQVSGTTRSNIFVISYQNQSPTLAKNVVEALLTIFVEKSLGESRKDTSTSKQFLDRQIADYEAKLKAAEDRLKEFKRQNVGMMPGEGKGYYSRLEEVHSQLANAELQLREARNRRDALKSQLRGEEPAFGFGSGPTASHDVTTPVDGRIQEVQKRLDDLRLRYTDEHPDVIATQRLLDNLKEQQEKLREQAREAQAATSSGQQGLLENPVYQDLKVAIGNAEAEVAALETRVEEFRKREEELRKAVDTIPKIEAELASLNRDYEVNRRNYEELVKRREALNISEEANQTSDDMQFNVVEPPRVPLVPVSPNRELLSALVLVIGLGAGVGLAWLIAMVRPTIYSATSLSELTSLPVFGTVSRIWTRREMIRRRLAFATYLAGCSVLFGMYGGLVVMQGLHVDLASRLSQIDTGILGRLSEVAGNLL